MASGSGPTVAYAVAGLRSSGHAAVAVALVMVAPGRLADRAAREAAAAGATWVGDPIGSTEAFTALVADRVAAP